MKAWILYDKESADYNSNYIQMYVSEGKKLGIQVQLVYREDLFIGNDFNGLTICFQKEKVHLPDFVINRTRDAMLARQFEGLGISVFNNSEVTEVCNDKARTYQKVSELGICCVPAIYHRNSELALVNWSDSDVIKSVNGHGGKQVFLGKEDKSEIINKIGCSDFVVQPYIRGPGQDVRVYLVGNEVVAVVRRQAENGFKANYSLGGSVSLIHMKEKQIKIVEQICKHFSFSMVGIDFIIDEKGNWLFNEIEDVVGARMLYQCSSIHIVREYLLYIKKHMNERRFKP